MWLLLALSLIAAGVNRAAGLALLLPATLWALWSGVMEPVGVMVMGFVALIALLLRRYRQIAVFAVGAELFLLFVSITLLSHIMPGFNNPLVVDHQRAGPLSLPFSLSFHFDKALLPFILLAVFPSLFLCKPISRPRHGGWWWLLIFSVPLLLLLATALKGLTFERHMPPWFWSFALANLFFVSLAEEAFFRSYLQRRLSQWLGPLAGLLISALLFGVSHLAGGPLLVLFAALAGIIYGLAWMWSGSLWVAALFHFALNLLHLLFFTYPA